MSASEKAAYAQLEARHRDWLLGLLPTLVFHDEIFLCHGKPRSDTTYWMERVTSGAVMHMTPIEDIEREAEGIDFPLILCGHTHIPRVARLRDGRHIVNPGSVGCRGYDDDAPVHYVIQSGTPDACYGVLEKDGDRWTASFQYVPYDHTAMSEMARAGDRPEWASALASGWVR